MALYHEFDHWCSENGQNINLLKSSIIFFRRKSQVAANFPLQAAISKSTKMLGVYVDYNYNFRKHVAYLCGWLRVRTLVLKRLRLRLGLSVDVLLRVSQCYRSKLCFGTWWLLTASDTTLATLDSAFSRCVRATLGFSKLVPAKVTHEFSGVTGLLEYLPYWGATRSVLDHMRENFDIFDEYSAERACSLPTPKHAVRASTAKQTLESHIRANSKFPVHAVDRFESMKSLRTFGISAFRKSGLAFKGTMKSRFLSRILAKGTCTADAVKEINERYYARIAE